MPDRGSRLFVLFIAGDRRIAATRRVGASRRTDRHVGRPSAVRSGGGYFRLYPYWLTHWGIKRWNERGVPVMVYVHPWEFDPDQPRMKVNLPRRFKHYVNLETNREKFARLICDFKFVPCRDYL